MTTAAGRPANVSRQRRQDRGVHRRERHKVDVGGGQRPRRLVQVAQQPGQILSVARTQGNEDRRPAGLRILGKEPAVERRADDVREVLAKDIRGDLACGRDLCGNGACHAGRQKNAIIA